ncbi:MAG: aldose 1-epimerase [Thermoleophilaceae bacterium]
MNDRAHTVSDATVDGFPVVVLGSPGDSLEAAFAPGVGMVGCSLRHRGEELLGQRGGLAAYAERGSSFGIPLLHPWANRLGEPRYRAPRSADVVELDFERMPLRQDEHGLPIHGVLAASPHWEVVGAEPADGSARLEARLDFGANPELLAAFPFPHELRIAAELAGTALTITTELTATGVVPVPVSFGWHPYLTLPGAPRAAWLVELAARHRALLDRHGIPTGETEPAPFTIGPLGDRAFDDLFPELSEPARFTASGGGRRIAVELVSGYPVAQVYSPADADFVCFEPMTAPTNALVTGDALPLVEPGATFAAVFRVAVEDLPDEGER